MIKSIPKSKARSRKLMLRTFLRWAFYVALLLLFYVWLTAPLIKGFCPLLIIPLATAVAVREGELSAGIFGAVCGLMIDMASGTLLGFTALWLLICCPVISLLSYYYVKVNFISHFVLNLAVSVIVALLDFMFMHSVWEGGEAVISLVNTILPAYIGAIVGALPVYFAVSFISSKLRPKERHRPEEASLAGEDSVDITRN